VSLIVTTPGDAEIVLSRAFDAPRHLVWDAWTKPELLKRWYGAKGWNLVECEVDLRVGGRWRFVSRGPNNETMGQAGVYREITPPERIVTTELFDDQSYPGETLITHVFTEHANRTTLTSTLRYATPTGRDIVLGYPMRTGVAHSYERLDDLLAEKDTT
jgi:uncharacterized protein YndB with AHSA1/START domain